MVGTEQSYCGLIRSSLRPFPPFGCLAGKLAGKRSQRRNLT